MSYKLYINKAEHAKKSPINAKILIAAKIAKINLELVEVELGKDNKTEEYLKKNPAGTVPLLEKDGKFLFESNAILKYIAKQGKTLLGANDFEAALVDQWLDFISGFEHGAYPILAHSLGYGKAPSKGVRKEASDHITAKLEVFNTHLKNYTYLAGERLTVADIALAAVLSVLFKKHITQNDQEKYKSVTRFFKTVSAQPEFDEFLGSGKKEGKSAKVRSSFNMEEWKRIYMNSDARKESIPYFFENLDRNNNVVYFCEYKYPEDCKKSFMTRNLIQGVMNRFTASVKSSFGTFLILGDEEKHTFKGMLVFESADGSIPTHFSEVDDFEIFDWRKADLEADKERICDFLAWDKPIDGMPVMDGKVYR